MNPDPSLRMRRARRLTARRRALVGLLAVLCAVQAIGLSTIATPIAAASAGNAVINDCQSHGELTHTYTRAQLEHALAVMSATVKEYSNCQTVIENALTNAKPGSGTGTGGGGGGGLSTVVIVVIVVVVLLAAGVGGLAVRRRRAAADGRGPDAEAPTRVIDPRDDDTREHGEPTRSADADVDPADDEPPTERYHEDDDPRI